MRSNTALLEREGPKKEQRTLPLHPITPLRGEGQGNYLFITHGGTELIVPIRDLSPIGPPIRVKKPFWKNRRNLLRVEDIIEGEMLPNDYIAPDQVVAGFMYLNNSSAKRGQTLAQVYTIGMSPDGDGFMHLFFFCF